MRHFLFSFIVLAIFSVSVAAQQTTAAQQYAKANSLIAEGDYADAVEILDQALIEVSDSKKSGRELRADILFALGKALYYTNEFDAAESRLKKSASVRKGKHSDTYVYLGLIELGVNRIAEATRYLNIAIATDPKNAEAWYELGKLLNGEGKNARAKIAFEKSVELGSTRSEEAKDSLARIETGGVEPLASKEPN